jgi:hypothetical protein
MEVQYVEIRLTPWAFGPSNYGERELRIKVNIDGVGYEHREIIPRNDIVSLLDLLLERAVLMLKEAVRQAPPQHP